LIFKALFRVPRTKDWELLDSNFPPFFLLDQKETKNQGSRKIAKIYCMPLQRIRILAAFTFQSANALLGSYTLRKIFAAIRFIP
jgi:branched-subunit amino acid transport protein AzlD